MNEEEVKTEGMTEDYIQTINELKANTVSKADYEAMREENRKLLKTIVNNEPVEQPTQEEKIDIQALRNDLFNNENNNLQYAEKALKLRKALMDLGQEDPFVPQGNMITATDEDRRLAQKVADGLQECIDYAAGNSEVFTNELQRITKDVRVNRR